MDSSRSEILSQVIDNLIAESPGLKHELDIFDNASTHFDRSIIRQNFDNVYFSDRNVGFWSAIDWWLNKLSDDPPDYVYVIESDLIHHDFFRINDCALFLDSNPDLGGVRIHEYVVTERHLYDKDNPCVGSHRHAWRSHINRVTGESVQISQGSGDLYKTTFPAHVPAINRFSMMKHAIDCLGILPTFSEHDFQRFCHDCYQRNAILDGGLFQELAFNGAGAVGSFLPADVLNQMGYQTTRTAKIVPRNQYTVQKVT